MRLRTRVKFCGLTRSSDVEEAVRLGVDAVGFVFVPASPRQVSLEQGLELSRRLPAFVTPVGLFMDAPTQEVQTALDRIPGLLPQFHGSEDPDYCEQFGRPYLKAIGLGGAPLPTADKPGDWRGCVGMLFDSHAPGEIGGTGQVFDWSRLDASLAELRAPLVLAGGLDGNNVGAAIRQLQPFAVDVSSGIEASKGVKDPAAMQAFIEAVQRADASRLKLQDQRT